MDILFKKYKADDKNGPKFGAKKPKEFFFKTGPV